MLSQTTGVLTRPFHPHHSHNSGLLFQYILSEFLASQTEVKTIQQLSNRLNDHKENIIIAQLKAALIKLLGSKYNATPISPWNYDDGVLSRLRNYCISFLHNEPNNIKSIAMHDAIEDTWFACIQSLNLLNATSDYLSQPTKFKSLKLRLNKIIKCMQQFLKHAVRMTKSFYQDEYLIFFILRHHRQMNILLGERFVHKLLAKICPKGLQGTHDALSHHYTTLGFDHLLPLIQEKFLELRGS